MDFTPQAASRNDRAAEINPHFENTQLEGFAQILLAPSIPALDRERAINAMVKKIRPWFADLENADNIGRLQNFAKIINANARKEAVPEDRFRALLLEKDKIPAYWMLLRAFQ
jgi:hypothetical protein